MAVTGRQEDAGDWWPSGAELPPAWTPTTSEVLKGNADLPFETIYVEISVMAI